MLKDTSVGPISTLLKGMRARYVIALLSIAVLSVLSFAGARNIIETEASSASVINVSGRQRMLSQRIPMLAQSIADNKFSMRRDAHLREMNKAVRLMAQSHIGLMKGDADLGIGELESVEVHNTLFDAATALDKKVAAFLGSAQDYIDLVAAGVSAQQLRMSAAALTVGAEELLPLLNKVVKQFERESHAHVNRLQLWQGGILAIVLAVLALEGLVVFWPLERGLKRNFDLLLRSRERERRAREAAEVASEAKSAFLTSMNHELRTPMNAILGFTQLLEDNPKEPLTEDQEEAVDHILRSSHHLLKLIEELLDLNRIDMGQIELRIDPIPLRKIVDDCLSMVHLRAAEKQLTISDETLKSDFPLLRTDETRLKQAFLNLLTNAVKYTPHGGKVTISGEKRSGEMLRLRVTDTGSGIPQNKWQNLFIPFDRLGRESLTIEGTGVGLPIAKSIVEVLGGQIGLESEVGKGSSFWIDVPVSIRRAGICS